MPKKKTRPKILLLDIETAPTLAYIWDLYTRYVPHSQVAEPGYTISWAAKWLGRNPMMFKSVYHDGEKAMVKGVHKLLDEADIVIHYNGTKFDIPKLNQEFLELGMEPPAPVQEVDVYKTCKARFKLLSNSMSYVAKVLGIDGKVEHKGMDLWTECMAGDAKAWAHMKRYNIQDVRMLEQIYERVKPWIHTHPNLGLYDLAEVPICPNCGSHEVYVHPQMHHTKTMVYHRFKCRECGTWSRARLNSTGTREKKRSILVGVK
jgi:DNA polymerase elongation subunit (family B)